MSKLSTLIVTFVFTVLNGLAVPSSASETSFNSSTVYSSSSLDYLVYDPDVGILYLPAVEVVNTSGRVEVYQMQLYAIDDLENPTRFELGDVSLQAELIGKPIRYQPETGILELPEVYVAQQPEPRSFTLSWLPNTEPAQFVSIASNVTSPSPSSSEALQPQPIDPAAFNPFDHVGKKENVAPGQAKKIRFGEVELDIGADAVDQSTDLTIKNICEDLPPLDLGMVNVTKGQGNCKGFRFHPKGQKFKNKIKVKIPYDKNLLPEGYTEQEIKTYYFDTELGRWQVLERKNVDTKGQTVTSLTDHFTDMINSTVTVPESPETVAYNPTQIKGIKPIDPSAGIHLIEPPQANNMGGAGVSYPLEVPPGRAGMQPQLAVQYNSSGGNGWLGVGWDVGMQTVTIDTRWGVPRYDSRLETETYTLSGQQLTPMAHRGELQPRTAEKVFQPRIEGSFAKIIRRGNSPKNYSWEVTDKNGTVSVYGGEGATLADDEGNIFVWALRTVTDTHGNFMEYRYETVTDVGLSDGIVPGRELYLKTIHYTGYQNEAGPYQVKFVRDRDLGESRRVDVNIG